MVVSDGIGYEIDADPYVYDPEDPDPEPEPDPEPAERININTADFETLQEIVHIGPSRAEEIIELRPFDSLDDLQRVTGIGPARVEDIKEEGKAYVD